MATHKQELLVSRLNLGSNFILVVATIFLTIAACTDASINSLELRSQRPYLAVSAFELQKIPDEKFNLNFFIKNIGLRPIAENMSVDFHVIINDGDGTPIAEKVQTLIPANEFPFDIEVPYSILGISKHYGEWPDFIVLVFRYEDSITDEIYNQKYMFRWNGDNTLGWLQNADERVIVENYLSGQSN